MQISRWVWKHREGVKIFAAILAWFRGSMQPQLFPAFLPLEFQVNGAVAVGCALHAIAYVGGRQGRELGIVTCVGSLAKLRLEIWLTWLRLSSFGHSLPTDCKARNSGSCHCKMPSCTVPFAISSCNTRPARIHSCSRRTPGRFVSSSGCEAEAIRSRQVFVPQCSFASTRAWETISS